MGNHVLKVAVVKPSEDKRYETVMFAGAQSSVRSKMNGIGKELLKRGYVYSEESSIHSKIFELFVDAYVKDDNMVYIYDLSRSNEDYKDYLKELLSAV